MSEKNKKIVKKAVAEVGVGLATMEGVCHVTYHVMESTSKSISNQYIKVGVMLAEMVAGYAVSIIAGGAAMNAIHSTYSGD